MVRAALRERETGAAIARTAFFNVASAACAALGGVIVARAVGPTVRGEYAAVTAWFGVLLLLGEVGQTAAVCFYVARDPCRARGYVATSRMMMLLTGTARPGRRPSCWRLLTRMGPPDFGRLPARLRGSVIGSSAPVHFSLAGQKHRAVESGPSQPAGARPGGDHRPAAVPPADPAYRHRHGVVTTTIQLGDPYYWRLRSGLAPGRFHRDSSAPSPSTGDAAHRGDTDGGQQVSRPARALPARPAGDLGRYAIAAQSHPSLCRSCPRSATWRSPTLPRSACCRRAATGYSGPPS